MGKFTLIYNKKQFPIIFDDDEVMTLFYWMHRLLHANGWLYRVVHKQHHEFKATTVWASEYFGIVDMVLNILPGAIPAIAMKSHFHFSQV